jgi:hypothetical protein
MERYRPAKRAKGSEPSPQTHHVEVSARLSAKGFAMLLSFSLVFLLLVGLGLKL